MRSHFDNDSVFFSFQFIFLPTSNCNQYGPVFIIDDGSQPRIEIASKDRDIIAATFTHFLLKNIGGSETFKDKQDFFYHEVRKYHSNFYHEKLSLKVNRERILESSMKATKGFSVSDWCGNFEVTFQGEQGIDWGGLRREWFELICCALFDPRGGLFCSFHDKRQALVHPNPNRPAYLKLKHFEFAGKIVGKCLYESALGGKPPSFMVLHTEVSLSGIDDQLFVMFFKRFISTNDSGSIYAFISGSIDWTESTLQIF